MWVQRLGRVNIRVMGGRGTVKRQRQHKVSCHVITRAFQLNLLSQRSRFLIYNPLHCVPVRAPFEVPERAFPCMRVHNWIVNGVEERANSIGKAVECPASSRLYAHASVRHQHFWIRTQSTNSVELEVVSFLIHSAEQTVLYRSANILWLWAKGRASWSSQLH